MKLKTTIKCLFVTFFLLKGMLLSAQETKYTAQDSLRGFLSSIRSCYDVNFYDLNLRVDVDKKYISGRNTIHYKAVTDFKRIQIDLFENLEISLIMHHSEHLEFSRKGNAVFIDFENVQQKGLQDSITIHYEGTPTVAIRPPWDGGFSWEKDKKGRDWVGVSCEGMGASSWWPLKDHLSDEPDSMRITGEVPSRLMLVANGNLRNQQKLKDGFTSYEWFVSYPINSYNVSFNIAHYAHFSDTYESLDKQKLALDYYVLDYNLDTAKKHFEQVKPMLRCFENRFGKYPFWNDGYALVETSYWGMEHQGAVAYGNNYKNNKFGFDFIIVHESGHEYFGNSLSTTDHGELWIHESFDTYSDALYVECAKSYDTMIAYINEQKKLIKNDQPILGDLEVNYDGWASADMYYKGCWMLHTFRSVIDDDKLWFQTFKDYTRDFKIASLNTPTIIAYFSKKLNRDLSKYFNQYLKYPKPPRFVYSISKEGKKVVLKYKWEAEVKGFDMPLRIKFGKKKTEKLTPTTAWQTKIFKKGKVSDFSILHDKYYVIEKKVK